MPLNNILRKYTAGYKRCRSQKKIIRLLYMDDIKLFAKNEKELETLIHAVRIYSQNIGMEFGIEICARLVMKSGKWHTTGIEICARLVMKSGKWHTTDGMKLTNQDKVRTLREKETYKYLGISNKWWYKKNKKKPERISQEN